MSERPISGSYRPSIMGTHGMVASGHYLATQAGARILAECRGRAGNDWGKAFSCYYSGNFVTGYRQGYVQKVFASMRGSEVLAPAMTARAIDVSGKRSRRSADIAPYPMHAPTSVVTRRIAGAAQGMATPVVTSAAAFGIATPNTGQAVLAVAGTGETQQIQHSSDAGVGNAAAQGQRDEAFVF